MVFKYRIRFIVWLPFKFDHQNLYTCSSSTIILLWKFRFEIKISDEWCLHIVHHQFLSRAWVLHHLWLWSMIHRVLWSMIHRMLWSMIHRMLLFISCTWNNIHEVFERMIHRVFWGIFRECYYVTMSLCVHMLVIIWVITCCTADTWHTHFKRMTAHVVNYMVYNISCWCSILVVEIRLKKHHMAYTIIDLKNDFESHSWIFLTIGLFDMVLKY